MESPRRRFRREHRQGLPGGGGSRLPTGPKNLTVTDLLPLISDLRRLGIGLNMLMEQSLQTFVGCQEKCSPIISLVMLRDTQMSASPAFEKPGARAPEQKKAVEEWKRGVGQIFLSSRDSITLVDSAGNILAWNPSAERLYGWKEDRGRRQAFSRSSEGRTAPAPRSDRKYPAARGVLGIRGKRNHAPRNTGYRRQPVDGLEETMQAAKPSGACTWIPT